MMVNPRTLDYVEGDRPVILRTTEKSHAFSALGVEVTPPKGWSYLAVADDGFADRPTFVNEATHSIIRLQAFGFRSWPPIDREVATNVYENVTIEWIDADHRRIGRITAGDVDLAIVAMTHATSFEPNESMEEFCNSIRILGGD